MTLTPQKIASNTTYYTMGLIGQKILAFVYFIFVARFVGAEDIGKYILALSITGILLIFIDSGITPMMTRETAKDRHAPAVYLPMVIIYKAFASVAIYLVAVGFVNLFHYAAMTKQLVYLAGIVMVLDAFTVTLYGVLRGFHALQYESIAIIIYQLIVFMIGLGGLYLGAPVHILMVALIVASTFNILYAFYWVKRKVAFQLHRNIGAYREQFQHLIAISLPFAFAAIFIKIYYMGDTVLLSLLSTDLELGWYGVAHKFVFALEFIPLAFVATLFPAFSTYYIEDNGMLQKTFKRSSYYLMLLSAPIVIGGYIVAEPLIATLYGEAFAPSAGSLQILLLGMLFLFLNYPLGSLLAAVKRQKINMVLAGTAMTVSIVLNFLLIPRFGGVGAAYAFFVSTALLFIAYLAVTQRYVAIELNDYLTMLGKFILIALVMGYAIRLANEHFSLWIVIPLGAFIYFFLAWFFHLIFISDIKDFYRTVFQKDSIS